MLRSGNPERYSRWFGLIRVCVYSGDGIKVSPLAELLLFYWCCIYSSLPPSRFSSHPPLIFLLLSLSTFSFSSTTCVLYPLPPPSYVSLPLFLPVIVPFPLPLPAALLTGLSTVQSVGVGVGQFSRPLPCGAALRQ